MLSRNWQDIPKDRKFSKLFDGISCQSVSVEQKILQVKLWNKIGFLLLVVGFTKLLIARKPQWILIFGKILLKV